jgi:hypothetical protein
MAHLVQGGLAQLVERLLCKQDVSGSSPLTSTKPKPNPQTIKQHLIKPKINQQLITLIVCGLIYKVALESAGL